MPYLPFRRSGSANIVIGAGFAGATTAPDPVGDSGDQGYAAKPIVRWTDVPYQTLTGTVQIGVGAFHSNGIDRVEFSANGGPWKPVSGRSYNASSGVYDYNVRLDLDAESDGLVEIRAVVYPESAGTPRVMQGAFRASANAAPPLDGVHSFYLWSNAEGTYTRTPVYIATTGNDTTGTGLVGAPYLTISKAVQALHTTYGSIDGCEVRCAAGTYVYTLTFGGSSESTCSDRWFTITPAPGVAYGDVILTYGVHKPKLLRLHNILCSASSSARTFASEESSLGVCYWFDECDCTAELNGGRWAEPANAFAYGSVYVTGGEWHDVRGGPGNCVLSRNVEISEICEDVFNRAQTVLDCSITDVDGGVTDAHSDIFQIYGPGLTFENMVVDGLTTSGTMLAQGWAIKDIALMKDCAFVNVQINATDPGGVLASQFDDPIEHFLMMHCTCKQRLFFLEPDVDEDCTFIGNAFEKVLVEDAELAAVTAAKWQSNHFVVSTGTSIRTIGSDITTGAWSTVVVDEPSGDFTPIMASPLLGRFLRLVPRDAAGTARPSLSAVGAYERP